jgi:transporter family-2 protein
MWFAVLCAAGVGVLMVIQPVVNAALARYTGALVASTVSFLIGTILLTLLSLFMAPGNLRGLSSGKSISQIPLYCYLGGFVGAVVVFGMTRLVPKLGAVATMAMVMTGQIVISAAVDQFGLLGSATVPVTAKRLIGIGLLLVGTRLALRMP